MAVRKFTTYHPLKVLQGKRELLAKGGSVATDASSTADANTTEASSKSPTEATGKEATKPKRQKLDGVAGVIYDSWEYLCTAQDALTKIGQYLEEIEQLIRVGNEAKRADKDRVAPNKSLQKVKRHLDQYARSFEIKGDLVFSGRLRDKPKTLQMGERAEEVITLRVDPMHLAGLHLDRARIDSLPAAKKSVEFLLKAKIIHSEADKFFRSKIDNLDSRLRKFEDALKLEAEAATGGPIKFSSTGRYEHLKARQEREHHNTGETVALLLNLKI